MKQTRSVPFPCLILLLLSVAGISRASTGAPVPSYSITGVVIDSVTGNPVPRCHLDASLNVRNGGARRRPPASGGFDADEHGRFTIPLPSAGAWQLRASAPGYVSEAYDEHGNYSSAIVLTSTAPSLEIKFNLPPQARISGTVQDEAGEGVRNAPVQLLRQQLAGPETRVQEFSSRSFVQTDDRGAYEFANLPPGNYRLAVQAKPWYASSSRQRGFIGGARTSAAQNSSLDVTYQLTWYPGMDDATQAETLALKAGDERRADFHLVPIPSLHVQIVPPLSTQQDDGRRIPSFPVIERIGSYGDNIGFSQTSTRTGPQGQLDIGGLSPGTYRIRLQGQNQDSRSAVVTLSEGSSREIDFNAAAETMANVTVHFDGGEEEDGRALLVELTDTTSGQRFFPYGGLRPMPSSMRRGSQFQLPRDISLQIPPGRYEISVQNRGDVYLTGISAEGAEAAGRFLTVHGGDVALNLHTASGHATVEGTASLHGRPCAGAVILLVPAGLDDPRSFTVMARDQSNTDGSFDLEDIVPGQYILVAIDHGWDVNFSDAATLRNYLTQGVPMDLRSGASVKQDIDAQAP